MEKTYQARKDQLTEAKDVVNLIFADYQLKVNLKRDIKERLNGGNLKAIISDIISDTSLAEALEPLAQLLLTKNDSFAKHLVKAIQQCLF